MSARSRLGPGGPKWVCGVVAATLLLAPLAPANAAPPVQRPSKTEAPEPEASAPELPPDPDAPTDESEPSEPDEAKTGWEEYDRQKAEAEPDPAEQPLSPAAPAAVVAEPAPLRPANPVLLRRSKMLILGSGLALVAGSGLNMLRAYTVSGPCQRQSAIESSTQCEFSWHITTILTWGVNLTAIGLAGYGGAERGEYETRKAAYAGDPPPKTSTALGFGVTLIVVGFVGSVTARFLWLADRSRAEMADERLDFAKRSHAYGYYVGQQGAAIITAIGSGLAGFAIETMRVSRARPPVTFQPSVDRHSVSVGVSGRF